ncbi:MAG: serine hydrolase domain-containing protein [Vicinamibacterales bacterium]|nr:serine hydrolase domain-containing protein [Vicinamibacterales bacterium]
MNSSLTRWRSLFFAVATFVALGVGISTFQTGSLAAVAELARDLEVINPAEVGISAERLERLDAGMQAMVDDGKLAGISTMLARHGKVVYTDTVGKLDVSKGDPVELDSIFRIYSMTKPIVGVAMMMLHEEGKYQLNDPVTKYIPEFADLKVYTGEQDANGNMQVEDIERRRRITMRDLMKHTAGLGYTLNPRNPVHQAFIDNRVMDASAPLQTMIDKMVQVPLLAQPQTMWSYSAAVDVQGYLVEQLSGQPLGEFLQERIFAPLGMMDTGFYVPPAKSGRVAAMHNGNLQPTYEGRGSLRNEPPAGPSGGGGLYGTAPDYIRFAQMLLNEGELNGERLLSPRSIELMRANHLTDVEQATYRRPGQGWGLNFSVVTDGAASGESWSTGSYYWVGIAGTWFWVDPEEDLTFVGMIQANGSAINEVQQMSRSLVYQAVIGD